MVKKGTVEEFIEKARKIHGDKYDYSKVNYINSKTKICIICPQHGEFYTTPNAHLGNKRGCRFCGYEKLKIIKKSNTEEFIEKARKIHGDKYDYSKVNYINNITKVCIINKNGEEFWQTPNNHLTGYSCDVNKLDREKFIKRSKEIHGDKYDYSKVNYINANTKVCIICPEHGEFWQIPSSHLNSKGCSKCATLKNKKIRAHTLENFIEKARKVHGNKYDYSKVNYINNRTKVCIICPIHGEFWQDPSSHISGHECNLCKGTTKLTNKEFIVKAKEIHGDKYDYSKVEYINNHTKVCIVCPEHGDFWQIPNNHLKGQGCPKCNRNARIKETKLFNILKEIFSKEEIIHSYYNSKILGKQELDIYFTKHKIGIEFQGEQHFRPIDFGNYGKEKSILIFKQNQERDIKKKNLCKQNGIHLFYFSNVTNEDFLGEKVYHDYLDLIQAIDQVIKKESEKQ